MLLRGAGRNQDLLVIPVDGSKPYILDEAGRGRTDVAIALTTTTRTIW